MRRDWGTTEEMRRAMSRFESRQRAAVPLRIYSEAEVRAFCAEHGLATARRIYTTRGPAGSPYTRWATRSKSHGKGADPSDSGMVLETPQLQTEPDPPPPTLTEDEIEAMRDAEIDRQIKLDREER